MVYALIICAGKQSRFKCETPKALVDVCGKTLLQRNLETLDQFCDQIYVVVSVENQHHFDLSTCPKAEKVVINSGKGSGDAVWQVVEKINLADDDQCYVMWGDSLQKPAVCAQVKDAYRGVSLIPCVREDHPYVQIADNGTGGVSAKFSKFGEQVEPGYHDLSIFYFNAGDLRTNLRAFRAKILAPNGQDYVHRHGNEMEFVDIFNETTIPAQILPVSYYREFAFNTVDQFQAALDNLQLDDYQAAHEI